MITIHETLATVKNVDLSLIRPAVFFAYAVGNCGDICDGLRGRLFRVFSITVVSRVQTAASQSSAADVALLIGMTRDVRSHVFLCFSTSLFRLVATRRRRRGAPATDGRTVGQWVWGVLLLMSQFTCKAGLNWRERRRPRRRRALSWLAADGEQVDSAAAASAAEAGLAVWNELWQTVDDASRWIQASRREVRSVASG